MIRKILFILFLSLGNYFSSYSQDTVIVATYNLLRFDSDTDRNEDFLKVVDLINADIYITQELNNQGGVDNFLNNILNFNTNIYESAFFYDESDIDQALFYNKNKFDLVATSKINGDPRNIMVYQLQHILTERFFYVFNMHLKASGGSSNEQRRLTQVTQLMNYVEQMDEDFFYVAAGDFNIYSTNEPAYRKFFEETSTGYGKLVDIISAEGKYNNPDYSNVHTQSPRTSQFGGGASGGLDDRFDYLLFSDSLIRSEQTFVIENTYTVLGNDGNHYDQAINIMPNDVVSEEIANALHDASDHLPVFTKIVFSNEIVTPVNYPPVADDVTFSINENPENGKVVGTITASDPEGDQLTYSILSGNTNNIFSINSSGEILVEKGSEIIYNNYQSFIILVEVSDNNNTDNAQITINVIEDPILSIESLKIKGLKIYPNPITNQLIVSSKDKSLKSIDIISLDGKKVFYSKSILKKNIIDFKDYSSGIYILNLLFNESSYKIRVIKKDLN